MNDGEIKAYKWDKLIKKVTLEYYHKLSLLALLFFLLYK